MLPVGFEGVCNETLLQPECNKAVSGGINGFIQIRVYYCWDLWSESDLKTVDFVRWLAHNCS